MMDLYFDNWLAESFSSTYKVKENEEGWSFKFLAPNLTSDKVDVSLKDKLLVIKIEESDFIQKEIYKFAFGYYPDPKSISASLDRGVLEVIVKKPKKEEVPEYNIKITQK